MEEVTLLQVLQAREERVALQKQLLETHRCPLICFTMNIAGPVKDSALIRRGFFYGLAQLEGRLTQVRCKQVLLPVTGPLAMLAVEEDPQRLKDICVEIEEAQAVGRLFDMDVLTLSGEKLERASQRGCIVCGAPGRGCAAGRLHTVEQLQEATQAILADHFAQQDCEKLGKLASQCLLQEAYTTPKPGLVDRRNTGSHKDMTLEHFEKSAKALEPYFTDCVRIGQETGDLAPEETFARLRQAGIQAEKTMYAATGGVNTHKGAIYTFGVLCGSLGRLWQPDVPAAERAQLLETCAELVKRSVSEDFAQARGDTAGEQVFLERGIPGIRGEVAAGLPAVRETGLPEYELALSRGLDENHAGCVALLHLMARVEDTTAYRRGGPGGAIFLQRSAQDLLEAYQDPALDIIARLDDSFISRNLTAGGCADLLAVTYFLHKLKNYQ